MSAYDNFLQFAGQKDRVTCCAQVTQLFTLDWDVHNDDNTLAVMQLDIINAFCSVCRQTQVEVLAEKASTSYNNGNVRDGDMIPCAPSLRKYCGYFQSMQAHSSTLRFIDHRGQPYHLTCLRVGSRAMVSRQYDLLSRSTLPLVVSFNVTLPAKEPPFVMIFSLLLLIKML